MITIHFYGTNFQIPKLKENQSIKQYLGGEIDFQKLLGNINLPWPGKKYPREKHVFGHNYTGVGTRLDIRLDENDKPKQNEEPKNRVDLASYHHDLKYRDSGDNLELKHKADKEMIIELDNIQNPTFAEKFQRALVKKAIQSKLKLGIGFPARKAKQEAIEKLFENEPKIEQSSWIKDPIKIEKDKKNKKDNDHY